MEKEFKTKLTELYSWEKWGMNYSENLQYCHRLTAIAETYNIRKTTTKYFNMKMKLGVSKNDAIYYKGRASEDFFKAWKDSKEEMKANGWSLFRGSLYRTSYKGSVNIRENGTCWYAVKYLTRSVRLHLNLKN